MRIILVLVLLTFGLAANGQPSRLNFDFEPGVNAGQPLLFWSYVGASGVAVRLDSTVAKRGRGSILFDIPATDPTKQRAFMTYALPIDSVRGERLTVRGYIRTAGFQGRAGLYAKVYGSSNQDVLVQVDSSRQVGKSSEWQRVELQFPVPIASGKILLGMKGTGTGRIWFDALELTVGTKPYYDGPLVGSEVLARTSTLFYDWNFERPQTYPPHLANLLQIDSADAASGGRSLRVISEVQPAPFLHLGTVPIEVKHLSKSVTVKGYLRQLNGSASPAQLYAAVMLAGKEVKRSNPPQESVSGAQRLSLEVVALPAVGKNWQPFTVTLPLAVSKGYAEGATLLLSLGTHPTSKGQYSLDDLHLSIEGKPLKDGLAVAAEPSIAELAWLRQAVVRLPLAAPEADLGPLHAVRDAFGSARVVGLGQVTYGSHELLQQKHRLFRLLAEQKGFTCLVLDADMSACKQLDAYLQTGKGNLPQLLLALGSVWNNVEIHALIEWMRTHNLQAGSNKLRLVGMSISNPTATLATLSQSIHLQAPEAQVLLNKLQQQLNQLGQGEQDVKLARDRQSSLIKPELEQVSNTLKALETLLDINAKADGKPGVLEELNWRRQQLRLLSQFVVYTTMESGRRLNYRAACQADNIVWLSGQQPQSKMVVWAHNQNVALWDEFDRPLGQWLRNTFGKGYFSVALTFHEGTYSAEDVPFVTAQASYAGTSEYWFHRLGFPAFFLSLQSVTALNDQNAWLFQKQLFRDIQLRQPSIDFHRHDLRKEFDAVVFIGKSTAISGKSILNK